MADNEFHARMFYYDRWPSWVAAIIGAKPMEFRTTEILVDKFSDDMAAEAWQICVRARRDSDGEVELETISATVSFDQEEFYVHIRFLMRRNA